MQQQLLCTTTSRRHQRSEFSTKFLHWSSKMGIANVIQTATSATHHHHHHTELPKISSKTELLIGIMKSQRVKKNKKKHQLCGYLQEFCGSARIPTIVTLLGGIVVASFPSCSSFYLMCMLYPTTTTTTNTNFFNIIKLE